MFNGLDNFYVSKEWKTFRQGLIQKRVSPKDGILYSDYSGKPLIKTHDIVLHHKIPLTSANVHNFDISLNEKNIMIVSHQEHNEIHSRFGNTSQRKVYVVSGSPCSGKTTFVNNNKGMSDLVIDIDNIWQALTGGDRYYKPNALKQNVFAVRDCLYDMVKTRAGKWERAWIITSESNDTMVERLCERLGAEHIEIDADEETCIKNLYDDPKGRDVELWSKLIKNYYDSQKSKAFI